MAQSEGGRGPYPDDQDDQYRVERWLANLERTIAELEPGIAAGHHFKWNAEHQLFRSLALRELLARGLDPDRPRTFRGRILLEVRCQRSGHVLARVYPTSIEPILVPSVSQLPEPDLDEADYVERYPDDPDRTKPWMWRNRWFQGYSEDDDDEDHLTIPGTRVLGQDVVAEGPQPSAYDGGFPDLWDLFCRCGKTVIREGDVFNALADKKHTLVVPPRPSTLGTTSPS